LRKTRFETAIILCFRTLAHDSLRLQRLIEFHNSIGAMDLSPLH
jgi:hypothetical protein